MSQRNIIRLVIALDVGGPVPPDALMVAHRAAEDAAGEALRRGGATSVMTLAGTMTKAAKRGSRGGGR